MVLTASSGLATDTFLFCSIANSHIFQLVHKCLSLALASLILVLCFRNYREGHHQVFQLPTSCFMSGCAESIQTLIFYHHTLFRTNCKKPKQNKSYSVTRPRWHHRYFVMMKSSENNLQKRQTPLPPPPGHPTIV